MYLTRVIADIQLHPKSVKHYREMAKLLKKHGKLHEAQVFEELAEHVNGTHHHEKQHPEHQANNRFSPSP